MSDKPEPQTPMEDPRKKISWTSVDQAFRTMLLNGTGNIEVPLGFRALNSALLCGLLYACVQLFVLALYPFVAPPDVLAVLETEFWRKPGFWPDLAYLCLGAPIVETAELMFVLAALGFAFEKLRAIGLRIFGNLVVLAVVLVFAGRWHVKDEAIAAHQWGYVAVRWIATGGTFIGFALQTQRYARWSNSAVIWLMVAISHAIGNTIGVAAEIAVRW